MRLHKSEAAFFLFIAVILAAGVMIFHAYDVLFSIANGLAEPERYADVAYLSKLLFATGLLLATGAMVFYDYVRGWKYFQLEFNELQQQRIDQELQAAQDEETQTNCTWPLCGCPASRRAASAIAFRNLW